MVKQSIIKKYLKDGKKLTLLASDSARPILEDWSKTEVSDQELFDHKGNIGWRLTEGWLVVDVDPRNGGDESFEKLQDLVLSYNPMDEMIPSVHTPRGGRHFYMRIPSQYKGYKFKKTLENEYPGIDFLTTGAQCAIGGCVRQDGKYTFHDDILGSYTDMLAPESLIKLIIKDFSNSDSPASFDDFIKKSSYNWTEDKVLDMLDKLDPSMGHDDWVRVGMALHHWDEEEGLKIWEEWSKGGENYQEDVTFKKWRSFDGFGGVTLGTVSHMVKGAVFDQKEDKIKKYRDFIGRANSKEIELEIIPKIRKETDFNYKDINILAKDIQNKLKTLNNVSLPIGQIRKEISNEIKLYHYENTEEEVPEWCEKWVYVNSHSTFVNLDDLQFHKPDSFNIENNVFVPMSESGQKTSAVKYASDRGFLAKVHKVAYMPMFNEKILTLDGFKMVNVFNPASIPQEAEHITDEGHKAIKRIKRHIKMICGTHNDAEIFTQWLAHQIQYPGVKILWSPVIQSIQGLGKSFFGELMRLCLGNSNVGTVSPNQITSDFNGWAVNKAVNVLEELRVKGKNRHDVINALKPLITDRKIQINQKGVPQYDTYNVTNYICFTNYRDAIPIEGDDRRWWIIFSRVESLDELEFLVNEKKETYFPNLFEALRSHYKEIRKWLKDYPITDKFMAMKQAPSTIYKTSMISMEEEKFDGLHELRELVEKGGEKFNSDIISSSHVFSELMLEHPEIHLNNRERNMLLKKLGYIKAAKTVKIDGEPLRIWTKRPMSNEEMRTEIMNSLVCGDKRSRYENMKLNRKLAECKYIEDF